MDVTFEFQPAASIATLKLQQGEQITTEGGCLVMAHGSFNIQTSTMQRGAGGFFRAAKRMFGGESFFLNHYQAGAGGAEITVAPDLPGAMTCVELKGDGIVAEAGSFVACEQSIKVDTSWQGLKSMFAGEGLFWLRMSGQGKVVLNSFGEIYTVDVTDSYIVDSGHIVAFQDTLQFEITKAGNSWLQSFLGGEGFVCQFKGRGRVWCQSHKSHRFGLELGPSLRQRS
jgi:uncharacterized protein (TIGR00266 family)